MLMFICERRAELRGMMPPLRCRGTPHKEIRPMAEDTFTLTTFYTSWKEYQEHIKGALAPLTAEQLELRASPHLRCTSSAAVPAGSPSSWAKTAAPT